MTITERIIELLDALKDARKNGIDTELVKVEIDLLKFAASACPQTSDV